MEGRVATIRRHREKLDRRTGLSRQIRAQEPDSHQICKRSEDDKPSEFRGSGFQHAKNYDIENPDIAKITIESGPSNPEWIKTVDHSSVRIGVRDFEMSKSLVNENPEIAKRDIAIQSQPSMQDHTRTVDHSSVRNFGDRVKRSMEE